MVVSVLKNRSEFLDTFQNYPKGIGIVRSASGVESEYPVNPVQPLGHFGCRHCVKEQNGRGAGETIGHSRGNGVLMSFITAFSHLYRVEVLITEQASRY